jgi:excisionase family DNA binding protein
MKNELLAPVHQRPIQQTKDMQFFTIPEVAEFLSVSQRTVRRWIKQKKLIAHHFGAAVRIADGDLSAFIARHRGP